MKLQGCVLQSWGKGLRSAGGEKVQEELWRLVVLVGTVLAPALRAHVCVISTDQCAGFGQHVAEVECI